MSGAAAGFIADLAERIEFSSVGVAIAESGVVFPLIEGVHLIGLSLAVGLIVVTDLRLIGLILRRIPASAVLHSLRPYVLTGFALIFVSGVLLFWSEAGRVVSTGWVFPLKLLLIALAGINALYFERVVARGNVLDGRRTPAAARFAGITSIVLWSAVIATGRLLAYLQSVTG